MNLNSPHPESRKGDSSDQSREMSDRPWVAIVPTQSAHLQDSVLRGLSSVLDQDRSMRQWIGQVDHYRFFDLLCDDLLKMREEIKSLKSTIHGLRQEVGKTEEKGNRGYKKIRKSLKNGLAEVTRRISKFSYTRNDSGISGRALIAYEKGLEDLHAVALTLDQEVPSDYSSSISSRPNDLTASYHTDDDMDVVVAKSVPIKKVFKDERKVSKDTKIQSGSGGLPPISTLRKGPFRVVGPKFTTTGVDKKIDLNKSVPDLRVRERGLIDESEESDPGGELLDPEYVGMSHLRGKTKKKPLILDEISPEPSVRSTKSSSTKGLWEKMDPEIKKAEKKMEQGADHMADKMIRWLEKKEAEEKSRKDKVRLKKISGAKK